MTTLEKAIEIAAQAHAGAKDKQGHPYILHPIRVMMDVDGATAKIVAVLHDVVEDTSVSLADLHAQGFNDEILDALSLVTHRDDQSYSEYVIACSQNEVARQVKLADLRDNAALKRTLLRPEKFDRDSARIMRYVLSYHFLINEITENEYRNLMVEFEK